jgi:8-oxo-dGTP diphosphatase
MSKNEIKQKAGVVAYRQTVEGRIEILVVSGRKYPNSWLFPVGTVEPPETLAQAAARECLEESGYRVQIGPCVATIELPKNKSIQRFTFFLGQVIGEVEDYEQDRQRRWLPQAELLETVSQAFAPVARAAMALTF